MGGASYVTAERVHAPRRSRVRIAVEACYSFISSHRSERSKNSRKYNNLNHESDSTLRERSDEDIALHHIQTSNAALGVEHDEVKEWLPIARPHGYPTLDYKPLPLQSWVLVFFTSYCLACLILIAVVMNNTTENGGVFQMNSKTRALGLGYLPGVLGALTSTLLGSVIASFCRMFGYLMLSSTNEMPKTAGEIWRRYLRMVGLWALSKSSGILITVVTSLLTTFASQFWTITELGNEYRWSLSVSTTMGHTLIAVYTLLLVYMLFLLPCMHFTQTGLRWDANSIADQLAMAQYSNVLKAYESLDIATVKEYITLRHKSASQIGQLRLGYWHAAQNESLIRYGYGFLADGRCAVETSETGHPRMRGSEHATASYLLQEQFSKDSSVATDKQSQNSPALARYRSIPAMLHDIPLLVLTAIGCFGIITAVVFLAQRKNINGFDLVDYTLETTPTGYVGVDLDIFLSSLHKQYILNILSGVILNSFVLVWGSADNLYRHTQPYTGMVTPAPAEHNILLDYVTPLVPQVIYKAIRNRHWRVAWFALLELSCSTAAVASSKIFTLKTHVVSVTEDAATSDSFRMALSHPNFYLSFAVLIIYTASLAFARPPPQYRMPRVPYGGEDVFAYCAHSNLVDDAEFKVQMRDDTKWDLQTRIRLRGRLYQFGMYLGKDGERHLGIDVAERRDGYGRVVGVDGFALGRALMLWPGRVVWLRVPRVVGGGGVV